MTLGLSRQLPEGWQEIPEDNKPLARLRARSFCPGGKEDVQMRLVQYLQLPDRISRAFAQWDELADGHEMSPETLDHLRSALAELNNSAFEITRASIAKVHGRTACRIDGHFTDYRVRKLLFVDNGKSIHEVSLFAPDKEFEKYETAFRQFIDSIDWT